MEGMKRDYEIVDEYLSDVRNGLIPERGIYLNEDWIEADADADADADTDADAGSLLVVGFPEYHDVLPVSFSSDI